MTPRAGTVHASLAWHAPCHHGRGSRDRHGPPISKRPTHPADPNRPYRCPSRHAPQRRNPSRDTPQRDTPQRDAHSMTPSPRNVTPQRSNRAKPQAASLPEPKAGHHKRQTAKRQTAKRQTAKQQTAHAARQGVPQAAPGPARTLATPRYPRKVRSAPHPGDFGTTPAQPKQPLNPRDTPTDSSLSTAKTHVENSPASRCNRHLRQPFNHYPRHAPRKAPSHRADIRRPPASIPGRHDFVPN